MQEAATTKKRKWEETAGAPQTPEVKVEPEADVELSSPKEKKKEKKEKKKKKDKKKDKSDAEEDADATMATEGEAEVINIPNYFVLYWFFLAIY